MQQKIEAMRPALFALMFGVTLLAQAGETVEVSIEQMKFVPQVVKIKPGSTVKWVNRERRNNHSILFESEGLPESERFFPGESWQRTFSKPGTYPYVCGPHPEMTGVVEVVE
ncbi:MAG: plastocyanin/azurin family copper-binding protein [Gammaproteobacteria bacterium]|nr:plastocyanin/azurin family copper-binding protein [Gammaproteobacteria bacterium]